MKNLICLICISISLYSCKKSEEIPVTINTEFKHHILAGYDVTSIAFDNHGNAWVGTYNKPELIKYNLNSKETVSYNSSNLMISDSECIWDIAVDKKNNIWIGSDGLIKFDGVNFTKYTSKNTGIPVDFIHSMRIDSKDNIWFSSSSHREGGLVKYDGVNWTVTTPDNSDLPMNGVRDIAIDKNDNVWLAQYTYLGKSCLVKMSNDTWSTYTNEELGFTPAWWGNIEINSKGQVCGAIDYTYSDKVFNPRPQAMIFDGVNCKQLKYDNFSNVQSITVDNEDNIWCKSKNGFAVFDGSSWLIDSLTFKNIRIEKIVQSKDNKIWIGTENGIYIND